MKLRTWFTLAAGCLILTSLAHADIRVSAADALKSAIAKPAPQYSAVARQMKVAGRVELEVVIGTDGNVVAAKALTGNPLLTAGALQAVEKWKFTPFTADGAPTKAIVNLSFEFKP